MPRFYCPDLPHPRLTDRAAVLGPEESRHARKVLRLPPGSRVHLFNGEGRLAIAEIAAYDGPNAICHVFQAEDAQPPQPLLHLATAIPKGPRAEDMVNQLSQVGVDRLIPLTTQRSIVEPRDNRLQRFERHAIESAKQCGRLFFMKIDPIRQLHEVLQQQASIKLILHTPDPAGEPLAAARDPASDHTFPARLREAYQVLLLIGPEGGWSDDELALAEQAGFTRWSINPNTLRIETAGVVAASLIRYLGRQTGA